MGFSTATADKAFWGTPVLLTILVCIAFLGALVIEWSRPTVSTGVPSAAPATAGPFLSVVSSRSRQDLTQRLILSRDFELWHYDVTASESGLSMDVGYIHGSKDDLYRFVEMNRASAADLARKGGEVDVLITFRKLIAPDLFRRWAQLRALKIQFAALRLREEGGSRGTLTVAARSDDPLPQERIDAVRGKLPEVMGVYSTRATVPAESLPDLVADPAIFVADVTPTLARLDFTSQGYVSATTATVNADSPFPEMEELGIVP